MHILDRHLMGRRAVLRAGAVSLGLPLLEAMIPSRAGAASLPPRRMVLIHRPLGTFHPHLVPAATGLNHETTRFLKPLEAHRGKFTVFSGMGHRGYPNSHGTEPAIFTGVADFKEHDLHNSVSLDHVASGHVAGQTRFRSLLLNRTWSQSLSWNEKGVPVPHEGDAGKVFQRLFIEGTPEEKSREERRLAQGKSILDGLRGELKRLSARLGSGDRERLEVLTATIREAEEQLRQEEAWSNRPKPQITLDHDEFKKSADNWVGTQDKWLLLTHAALQTDSTRVIVLATGEHSLNGVTGLEIGHHDASHHGKDPNKVEQLCRYEDREFETYARFLDKLSATVEPGGTLLDSTQALFTSNLGDASAHSSTNLPVLLAGGGHKHQGHVAYQQDGNEPLCNLYAKMLNQFGLETDRFGSGDGMVGEIG